MKTKLSFRCSDCGKEFAIKGHWYNQILIDWWWTVRWTCHCIIKHNKKLKMEDVLHILKMIVAFILLFPLQVLDIIATPFRYL